MAGKAIPETVLFGSIKKLSVRRTPMAPSTSPSSEKSGCCCGSGQSYNEPGFIVETGPG